MKIFDEDPITIPVVEATPVEEDATGRELLETLRRLQDEEEEARAAAREAGRPLSDLMAEADELAALEMVGDATEEEADAAEQKVQEAKDRIESHRRRAKQASRAVSLTREKLQARLKTVYEENRRAVRAVHHELARHALEAERRAALLLRILREFESHYARYTAGSEPDVHPHYLREHERTAPPRAIMGPARTRDGHVFSRSEASVWMEQTAEALDEVPPRILDVPSLEFETDGATPMLIHPDEEAPPEKEKATDRPDERRAQTESPDDKRPETERGERRKKKGDRHRGVERPGESRREPSPDAGRSGSRRPGDAHSGTPAAPPREAKPGRS